jgi:hypothetical protein
MILLNSERTLSDIVTSGSIKAVVVDGGERVCQGDTGM